MRTVELNVWTGYLGSVDITPVSRTYAIKHIGENPDDLYEEFEYTRSIFFCSEESNLKVKDGDNELQFDELPHLDLGNINEYKNYSREEILEEIEKEDVDEDDLLEYEEYYAWKLAQNANLEEVNLFNDFWNEVINDDVCLMRYVQMENRQYTMDIGEDASFVECGCIGKAILTYNIEIPEDEEFDIKKLHFISESDWFDGDPFIDEFCEAFNGSDVLLMVVEYDGKFYPLSDSEFVPGWKAYSGGRFFDLELEELEDDGEQDDEEDDENGFPIEDGEAQIPEGTTVIPNDAFWKRGGLRSVVIPDSVTSIGGWAFMDCEDLEDVVIGSGVEIIGDCAFQGCDNLTEIVLPESVQSLGESSFSRCYNLSSITFGGSITEIADGVFNDDDALETIYVPAGKVDYYKELLDDEDLAKLVVEQPAE